MPSIHIDSQSSKNYAQLFIFSFFTTPYAKGKCPLFVYSPIAVNSIPFVWTIEEIAIYPMNGLQSLVNPTIMAPNEINILLKKGHNQDLGRCTKL